MFANRQEAGWQLGEALQRLRATRPLVLGLPRGGVVVAAEVARALGGELDVMLVKKLRAPGNPELALGAVAEDGRAHVNPDVRGLTEASEDYLERERHERLKEMRAQAAAYRAVRPRVEPAGRTVVLVDDGLATGATMLAAVQCAALSGPERLVAAVPVGPPDTVRQFAAMPEVNEVVCLQTPAWFGGVGQFYEDFSQVSDEEVVRILREFAP